MKFLVGVLVVVLLALQYKLWVAEDGYREVRRLRQELVDQKTENDRLRARNQALQAEVEDLKSGLAAIEELARNELGMLKEGETFFQVIQQRKSSSPTGGFSSEPQTSQSPAP